MENLNIQVIDNIVQRIDLSADRNIFFDKQPYAYTQALPQGQTPSVQMLTEGLQNLIYSEFYTKPNRSVQNQAIPAVEEIEKFMEELSKKNTTQERFDEGWTVLSVDYQGVILAQKGSYKRHIQGGEYINVTGFGRNPQQGDTLKLFTRKEHKDPNGGFYFIFGNHQSENNPQQMVRVYFNIRPEGSHKLVETISTKLNHYQVPFQFKCLHHESLYNRADTAVLYVEKRYINLTFRILKQIYSHVKPYLNQEVPAFTRRLTDGIGFAENPLNPNESFGTNLSRMIALGILSATNQQMPKNAWKPEILKQFKIRHLDINALYLNPNTKFPYQFPKFN
jgi:hypothetical protein